jgi:hypothetical protein
LNLNNFNYSKSQILLQNSVLHIFRILGTYYLQFLDNQNIRY